MREAGIVVSFTSMQPPQHHRFGSRPPIRVKFDRTTKRTEDVGTAECHSCRAAAPGRSACTPALLVLRHAATRSTTCSCCGCITACLGGLLIRSAEEAAQVSLRRFGQPEALARGNADGHVTLIPPARTHNAKRNTNTMVDSADVINFSAIANSHGCAHWARMVRSWSFRRRSDQPTSEYVAAPARTSVWGMLPFCKGGGGNRNQ